MKWLYVGGGCGVAADGFCCDDMYRNEDGESVTFLSTEEAHWAGLPKEIDDMTAFVREAPARGLRVKLRAVP